MAKRFTEEEVRLLVARFWLRTLPKAEWTHAAHFAVALAVASEAAEFAEALARLRVGIRAYNEATGVANTATAGYHETITRASLGAAFALRADWPGATVAGLCARVADGPLAASGWMLRYWTREVLWSEKARLDWVGPDREALPFAVR